jgi:hypothetical protein
MRLWVNIYKPDYDCTNNGLSSKGSEAILIWNETREEIEKIISTEKIIFILSEGLGHQKYRALPITHDGKKWAMFGGNFLWSSDSRFPHDAPIPIHDRYES